jgi:hypothetical protein
MAYQMDRISYSKIEAARCPLYFKKWYYDKERPENERMKLGSLKHKIIYEYSRAMMKQGGEGDYEMLEKTIKQEFNASGLDVKYLREVHEDCFGFGETGFRADRMLDFEKHFIVDIGKDADGRTIKFEGVIDRVDAYDTPFGAALDVIDYKSAYNIIGATELDENEQLLLYQYVAMMHLYKEAGYGYGRKGIYYLHYQFLRYGETKTAGELAGKFMAIEAWIKEQWARIMSMKEFPPVKGKKCFQYDGCPYMDTCPAWDPLETEKLRAGLVVKDMVLYLNMLDHRRKQTLDQLKEMFAENEMQLVDGENVGYKESKSYRYKLIETMNFCGKYGVPMEDFRLAKTEVEQAVKKNYKAVKLLEPGALEELVGAREETASTSFVY